MKKKPLTTHITFVEGGDWIEWAQGISKNNDYLIHAIRFDDGNQWDCINGWRPKEMCDRWKTHEQA